MSRRFRIAVITVVLAICHPGLGWAQEQPAVFLHGLASSPERWAPAAHRMRTHTMIAPRIPSLDWQAPYAQQSQALTRHVELGALPSTTVAIGHSNGGIVAREWSRSRRMGGIVTLGTPHGGTPLVARFPEWVNYQSATPSIVGWVMGAFSRPSNTPSMMGHLSPLLAIALEFSWSSVLDLAAAAAIDLRFPVMADMRPGSPYLSGLNSSTNLHREAAEVPRRVGIATVAENFFWAGPSRAPFPEHADAIAATLYSTIAALEFWGAWVLINAEPGDFDAIEQAQSLFALVAHLASIDPVYCAIVSSVTSNECIPNDGVLPYTVQRYPNAINLIVGANDSAGPVHTRQVEQSDDVLYRALVEFMQIPPRQQGPAPPVPPHVPPPPTPPHEPPFPGDPSDPGGPDSGAGVNLLRPGDLLRPGESVSSRDARFDFIYQHDGNLVLYHHGHPLWWTGTHGQSAGMAVMQHDGNFVVYNAHNVPLWASSTSYGHANAWLVVQDDGNVVVYSVEGVPLWATHTAR